MSSWHGFRSWSWGLRDVAERTGDQFLTTACCDTNQRGGWRTAVCAFKKPSTGNYVLNWHVMEENKKNIFPNAMTESLLMEHGYVHLRWNDGFVLSVKTRSVWLVRVCEKLEERGFSSTVYEHCYIRVHSLTLGFQYTHTANA